MKKSYITTYKKKYETIKTVLETKCLFLHSKTVDHFIFPNHPQTY